jgi:hypothetical protein
MKEAFLNPAFLKLKRMSVRHCRSMEMYNLPPWDSFCDYKRDATVSAVDFSIPCPSHSIQAGDNNRCVREDRDRMISNRRSSFLKIIQKSA